MDRQLLRLLMLHLQFAALVLLIALIVIFVPHQYKNMVATPVVIIGVGFILFRLATQMRGFL